MASVSTSAVTRFEIGTRVRLIGKFKTFEQVPGSPTTVTLKVRNPSGVQSTPAVTANTEAEDGVTTEVGTYFGDVTVDETGVWLYRFEGVGLIETTGEGEFYVDATSFT